jgi:hypothetical protein
MPQFEGERLAPAAFASESDFRVAADIVVRLATAPTGPAGSLPAGTSVLDERRGFVRVFLLLLDRLLFLGGVHCLLLARFRGLMGHGSLLGPANALARAHTIGLQVECV